VCRLPRGASRVLCSPDGLHVAYAVSVGDRYRVEMDGVAVGDPEYEFVSALTFSPDGTHLAFAASENLRWRVVFRTKKFGDWDDITKSTPTISPDNQMVAFGANRRGAWTTVIGADEVGDAGEGFSPGGLVFAANSKRIAYAFRSGDSWRV